MAKEKLSLRGLIAEVKERQKDQPSLSAEMAAEFRAGREDLLSGLFGPMAGTNREPGEPGVPTPQQTTAALGNLSLDDLMGYAKERAAADRMDKGHDKERDNSLEM